MMTHLFSFLDPTQSYMKLNLSSLILTFLFLMYPFYFISNRVLIPKMLMKTFNDLVNSMISENKLKSGLYFLSLFLWLLIMNCMGLIPYIYTPSSFIMIPIILAFPSWISLMLYQIFYKTKKAMLHLIPNGTPMGLASFMVLIELLSQCIRPFTLCIRLTANLTAGHLLLILLSSLIMTIPNGFNMFFCGAQSLLMILEMAVALIQAYVFVTLIMMYFNE